ncbi:hypothetical protein [ANMV-1 virus]|nr:hypothetical protein [ANMV-1 virus]
MERDTKKVKKEGDTCRDCWTKRFRTDIYKQWRIEKGDITLAAFLKRELESRELEIKNMREEFADLYDEVGAIQDLAGDVFLSRFNEEDDDDQSA